MMRERSFIERRLKVRRGREGEKKKKGRKKKERNNMRMWPGLPFHFIFRALYSFLITSSLIVCVPLLYL
jgi:hypothetical protein